MNPHHAAAFFQLGWLTSCELVGLAEEWLLDGLDTPTLRILAGESDPQMWEVEPLFRKVMAELRVPFPNQPDATFSALNFLLQEIVDGVVSPRVGMRKVSKLNDQVDARFGSFTYPDPLRRPDRSVKHKFVGDRLGVEYMFAWWRELTDADEGSMVLYYTDLSIEAAMEKFEEHIIDEAEKRLVQLMDGGPRR
jgi:hypothetical protein